METLQTVAIVAPVLLFSIVAHEYAHGYAALKQGDTTALDAGRLTFNPLKHIDWFYTILLPIILYKVLGVALGSAKPVPVNPANYRNYRRGDIIVSLAGVATNFVLAFVFAGLVVVAGLLARALPALEPSAGIIQVVMVVGVQISLGLAVFNLLPIPPLDGSHVIKHLLPPAWAFHYQRLAIVGLVVILIGMRLAPGILSWWFRPAFFLNDVLKQAVRSFLTPTYYSFVA